MVRINEILDDGSGVEDLALEVIEEEIVRLAEEAELPPLLGGDDGGGAAAEASVVNSGDARLVVGELIPDFGFGYEGKLEFLGDVVVLAVGGSSRVFLAGRGIHLQKWMIRARVSNRQDYRSGASNFIMKSYDLGKRDSIKMCLLILCTQNETHSPTEFHVFLPCVKS